MILKEFSQLGGLLCKSEMANNKEVNVYVKPQVKSSTQEGRIAELKNELGIVNSLLVAAIMYKDKDKQYVHSLSKRIKEIKNLLIKMDLQSTLTKRGQVVAKNANKQKTEGTTERTTKGFCVATRKKNKQISTRSSRVTYISLSPSYYRQTERMSDMKWFYSTRNRAGSLCSSYSSNSDKGDYGLMDY